jgi:hypothetical protein
MTKTMSWVRVAAVAVAVIATARSAAADPPRWGGEWPNTDFSKRSVDLGEILSGGPPKDGIPSIDDPAFVPLAADTDLAETEPVIGLIVNGDARAYPLRILIWHEIVNDTVGGVPVVVTYCPLCNSAIVFERTVDGRVLDFGTTGKLRNSDLVMYDRQTDSWWQQFSGEAIVGAMTGTAMKELPSRLESWARFKARADAGRVLVPNDRHMRDYGGNPYVGYDSRNAPYALYQGALPTDVDPMMRVVAIGDEAWTLPLIRDDGPITRDDVTIRWVSGQNSALDSGRIAKGRDVGNVIVQRGSGPDAEDVAHDVTFAFVFRAFHPEGVIHQE